jgi:hypothetical protein
MRVAANTMLTSAAACDISGTDNPPNRRAVQRHVQDAAINNTNAAAIHAGEMKNHNTGTW